jgi:phosphoenolpyruvate carboxylase
MRGRQKHSTTKPTLSRVLSFAFDVSDEARNDPIYAAPIYVAEFFATVQQDFIHLVNDPDYAALLSLFGSNLLYRTGSRPVARESEEWQRTNTIQHPSRIRAITNHAILQQLGFMAITLHGAGRAVSKDPEMFRVMCERSARFGRAIRMVAAALDRSELDVLRAYVSIVNPSMWLDGAGRARRSRRVKAMRDLAAVTGRLDRYDRLARLVRRLQADEFWLLQAIQPVATPQRRRLILLHAIRVAVIQRICLLAMDIPNFSPQLGVTRDEIVERILELDVPAAVDRLRRIFPQRGRRGGYER